MNKEDSTASGGKGWEEDFDSRFFNPSIPSPSELKRFIRKQIESTARRCMGLAEESKPHLSTGSPHYFSDMKLCDALESARDRIAEEFGLSIPSGGTDVI